VWQVPGDHSNDRRGRLQNAPLADSGQQDWPMTLTEIGSWVGLATGIFTVIDRFFIGRLTASIGKAGFDRRDLECFNTSRNDVIITRVRTSTRRILIAPDHSVRGIIEGAAQVRFTKILKKDQQVDFPIIARDGVLEKDSKVVLPFVIIISWRKTRSMWLPQFPVFIFSSAKALRRLDQAK
jgi:hypothetical protein